MPPRGPRQRIFPEHVEAEDLGGRRSSIYYFPGESGSVESAKQWLRSGHNSRMVGRDEFKHPIDDELDSDAEQDEAHNACQGIGAIHAQQF